MHKEAPLKSAYLSCSKAAALYMGGEHIAYSLWQAWAKIQHNNAACLKLLFHMHANLLMCQMAEIIKNSNQQEKIKTAKGYQVLLDSGASPTELR